MSMKNTISIFQEEKNVSQGFSFFFLIKDFILINILESYTGKGMKAKESLFL